jgi:hypothetical protein
MSMFDRFVQHSHREGQQVSFFHDKKSEYSMDLDSINLLLSFSLRFAWTTMVMRFIIRLCLW